jgi:hypothetical protein
MGGSNPNWMKYRGKWGNPKTKCHPLRRIGLHVCEQTDGPTGIPKKLHISPAQLDDCEKLEEKNFNFL